MIRVVAEQAPDLVQVIGQFHAGLGAIGRWRHQDAPGAFTRIPQVVAAIGKLEHQRARIHGRLQHFTMHLAAGRLPATEAQQTGHQCTAEEQHGDQHLSLIHI